MHDGSLTEMLKEELHPVPKLSRAIFLQEGGENENQFNTHTQLVICHNFIVEDVQAVGNRTNTCRALGNWNSHTRAVDEISECGTLEFSTLIRLE